MALGTRDIMMIIRARDLSAAALKGVGTNLGTMGTQAGLLSTKMFNVGAAMTTIGVGIGAAGVAGLKFFDDSINAASKYNTESAKTLTQVDQLGVSLETIKDIGKEVALAIPAPFEEMQKSLYDIFSSMDVNVGEAKMLLTEFSRAAVAGQVDLQDASRATIGIMNAYGMKASEVNHVNDVMFQLVRKGVGTYGEFATTIGLATPAAVRAGQSIETLAGMIAFLTRNGLSASRAASSAGRALELMANSKVTERMEAMGVRVRDAAGEFLPMGEIVDQLAKKLSNLTAPERAKALEDLFQGGGNNVQARRFWDVAIKNSQQFLSLVDDMGNSKGTLDAAYETMFNAPQSKMQAMTNAYQVMRVEIGEQLLPVKLALAKAVVTLLKAWNGLSDGTKRTIVLIAAAAAVFATILGVVLTVGGAMAMLIATLMTLGMTLGGAIALIGGVAAALILIPALIYLIVTNWETLKEVALDVWNAISGAISSAWNAISPFFSWLADTFGPGIANIFNTIVTEVGAVLSEIGQTFQSLWGYVQTVWGMISPFIEMHLNMIRSFIEVFIGVVVALWDSFGSTILSAVQTVWNFIATTIQSTITIVSNIIQFFLNLIQGDWGAAWNNVKNILTAAWNAILAAIKVAFEAIRIFFVALPGNIVSFIGNVLQLLYNKGRDIIAGLKDGVVAMFTKVTAWFKDLPGVVKDFFTGGVNWLYQAGRNIIGGLINGIKSMAGAVGGAIGSVVGEVTSWLPGSPVKKGPLMVLNHGYAGGQIIKMLIDGIQQQAPGLRNILDTVISQAETAFNKVQSIIRSMAGTSSSITVDTAGMAQMAVNAANYAMDAAKVAISNPMQAALNAVTNAQNVAAQYGAPAGTQDALQRVGIMIQNATFGDQKVVADLDWWAKTQTAGV